MPNMTFSDFDFDTTEFSFSIKTMMSNDKIRQRVQSIYPAFTTDVDPDRLSDYLKKEGIISIPQYQEICNKNATPSCRCRALLDFLMSGSNPNAFLVVRDALEKENHYLIGALDDHISCLESGVSVESEDKKTIKQLQHQLEIQVEATHVLEKRLQEAECEIDKLRKSIDELKAERNRHQPKERRESNSTQITLKEIPETEATGAAFEEAKYSQAECATDTNKNKSYSDFKDRDSPLSPSDVKFGLFVAERSESIYTEREQSRTKITIRRGTSIPALMPEPVNFKYSYTTQKSATLRRPPGSRTSLASDQYEPFGTEQKGADSRRLPTIKSATLRSSNRRIAIGSEQCERIQYKEDPYLIKEIITSASKEHSKAIHGLSILDDELFIISRLSTNIEVHNAHRLILIRFIELKILEAPWDIVSCKINKCLYIMNWKNQNKGIIRIDRYGNITKQWSTGSNCGRLSITQDSNVIMAAYKSDTIIEYTAEGGLVREIKLTYMVANPQHAIKLNSSSFIVIHGMYDDVQQKVCLLDDTGSVLTSFGGEKGSDIDHLDGPISLAVDKAGTIFVAEYANSRVILLSRSLKFMRVLLSKEKQGLNDPWSIRLDEDNGRLFVVDNDYEERTNLLKDGRILVFNIL